MRKIINRALIELKKRVSLKICNAIFKTFSQLLGALLICSLPVSCDKNQNPDISKEKHLIIAASSDPLSLDPRLVRDLPTTTVMHQLFEGLMRVNSRGELEPAAAESILISEDQKTYTFSLRKNYWSNGEEVLANDFEQTWKSMLTPEFPAPNAYQLYCIKGAKEAKLGKHSIENVGIKSTDSSTLVVELEHPTPNFLEMTACHFFFPVNSEALDLISYDIDHDLDEHAKTLQKKLHYNGPFTLSLWKQRNEFSVIKNPYYWDKDQVKLDRITLQILDENTALQLFKTGKLSWAGSPLSTLPQDAILPLKDSGKLSVAPGAGTHLFRFNTKHFPFNNKKIRKAFASALNRQAIVDHVTQGNQLPALGFVPPSFGNFGPYSYADNDIQEAQRLLKEGIQELETNPENLQVSLCYATGERNHKIAQAIQQIWGRALNIKVNLESCEGQNLYDKLNKGLYQISLGSWYADFKDPINFLEIFKDRLGATNHTFWDHPQYIKLLNDSATVSSNIRQSLLAEADRLLIEEAPIAPLFHSSYNYLKNSRIHHVLFSELGYLDFKETDIDQDE